MSKPFEVSLDRERQIVIQRITGVLDEATQAQMVEETQQMCEQLDDPQSVYLLGETTAGFKLSPKIRRNARKQLSDPSLKKVAICGGGAVARVMSVFLRIALGDKIHWFTTKDQAVEWLMEGRRSGKASQQHD